MDKIFKNFNVKMNLKLNVNVIEKCFKLQIYPTKPSVGLPNLMRLSLYYRREYSVHNPTLRENH
jgi:hypothetical protein